MPLRRKSQGLAVTTNNYLLSVFLFVFCMSVNANEVSTRIGKIDTGDGWVFKEHKTMLVNSDVASFQENFVFELPGKNEEGRIVKVSLFLFMPLESDADGFRKKRMQSFQKKMRAGDIRKYSSGGIAPGEGYYEERSSKGDGDWSFIRSEFTGSRLLRLELTAGNLSRRSAKKLLKSFQPDLASIEHMPSHVKNAFDRIFEGNYARTPAGLVLLSETQGLFVEALHQEMDADGAVVRTQHDYYIEKLSENGIKKDSLYLGCGKKNQNYEIFRDRFRKEFSPWKKQTRFEKIERTEPFNFGGREGFKDSAIEVSTTDTSFHIWRQKWFAEDEDNYYTLSMIGFDDAPDNNFLAEYLASNLINCDLSNTDLHF